MITRDASQKQSWGTYVFRTLNPEVVSIQSADVRMINFDGDLMILNKMSAKRDRLMGCHYAKDRDVIILIAIRGCT